MSEQGGGAPKEARGGPVPADIEAKKVEARAWFEALRDRICAAFEAIEDDAAEFAALPDALAETAAGRFERTPWAPRAAAASCR
jgi:coproporphyrinogen III oxidase